MCESKVITIKDGTEVIIMEDVIRVEVRNDKIRFYDLLGESKEIKGRIIFMDLIEHKIIVEEVE
ncbi:MAG TPA: CooT family nickel-binding protein [Archaeoglobus profundus]|nr:CooT family nickel-binding protein [Archaeoglobus profundus]HIP58575.1 CooT family nickel-binding protein [Archaeoglobus profundus]